MHEIRSLLVTTVALLALGVGLLGAMRLFLRGLEKLIDQGSRTAEKVKLDRAWVLWMEWRCQVRETWQRHTPPLLVSFLGGLSRLVLVAAAIGTTVAGTVILVIVFRYPSPLGATPGGGYITACFLFAYGVVMSEVAAAAKKTGTNC